MTVLVAKTVRSAKFSSVQFSSVFFSHFFILESVLTVNACIYTYIHMHMLRSVIIRIELGHSDPWKEAVRVFSWICSRTDHSHGTFKRFSELSAGVDMMYTPLQTMW